MVTLSARPLHTGSPLHHRCTHHAPLLPYARRLCETVTTGSFASALSGPRNASTCSSAFATPRRASLPPRSGCHWCRPVLAGLPAPTRDPLAPRGSPSPAPQRCVGDPSSSSDTLRRRTTGVTRQLLYTLLNKRRDGHHLSPYSIRAFAWADLQRCTTRTWIL
jgi:hypothetical protein